MNVSNLLCRPVALALLIVLSAVACEVDNPGRILDVDLNSPAAMQILVTGMAADFARGHRDIGWNNAVLTGDLSGTSAYLSRIRHWAGHPQPEDADEYDSVYRASWVAEHGIERMKKVMGDNFSTSPLAAEAYVWAGYSNRLLGETMCQAVIDGGAPQPRTVYFERAEKHFSNAIQIAQAAGANRLRLAALGGRASVRVILGNWAGALADARQVPDDFVFYVEFSPTSGHPENQIFGENRRRVNLSVKYTWFEHYDAEYDDPRTPVFEDPDIRVSADGQSPHLAQGKYDGPGADIALTKGAEMRLIEAEYLIRTGAWQAGMEIINGLRAEAGVAPWAASNQEEAYNRLKKERAIVMWLEARRGGDLLRWDTDPVNDPILREMHENAPERTDLKGREICHPFSRTLVLTNPHIPNDYQP